jgi:hypothetical protein
MISVPYYLLAFGIFLIILGATVNSLAKLGKPTRSVRRTIDPTMRDEEITRTLKGERRFFWGNLIVRLGFLCMLVSVIWRMVRILRRF